jgi:tRNA (cmo5U34)-methyltransferase
MSDDQSESQARWGEEESERFITLGRIYTPRRDEILETFLDLIPAEPDDAFTGVELGTGAGWLTEGILDRFPRARMIGLDGSEAMRQTTARLLVRFRERFEIGPFRLEEREWRTALPSNLQVVVSSLVIHHLDGAAKRDLFGELFSRLAPGGALLICDVVESTSDPGRRAMANGWDAEVRRNALEIDGSLDAYDHFVSDHWNMYASPPEPDDIDFPSSLVEQLGWMDEAGFTGIDAWWVRAGHALFGGYKPANA